MTLNRPENSRVSLRVRIIPFIKEKVSGRSISFTVYQTSVRDLTKALKRCVRRGGK